MGKDCKSVGVNKAATAGGRNNKGTGGIPLTGKDGHKSLGVNKAANGGGNRKVTGGESGKRSGGGAARAGRAKGASGAGGQDRGGASTFCPTDHSTFKTAVKLMNEIYDEEENHGSSEDERSTFEPTDHSTFKTAVKLMNEVYDEEENNGSSEDERSTFEPTDHSTFKTAVKFTNECYDEEENFDLLEDEKYIQDGGAEMGNDGSGGDDCYYHGEENRCSFEDATFSPADHGTIGMAVVGMNEYYNEENRCLPGNEKDVQDDAQLPPYEDNNGAEMGGDGGYDKDAWVGDDGAVDGIGDDILNGDYYNYDVVGGFDDGYDNDGGDGADDWW